MKKSLIFKILYLFLVLVVVAVSSVFATNAYLSARDISYGSSNVEDALNGLFTLKGNDETYSTDAKVVGKWIDGRPIYRKVITGLNLTTVQNNWVTVSNSASTILPNATLISVSGLTEQSSTGIPMYASCIQAIIQDENVLCEFPGGRTLKTVIFEYTKTTDNPSNN